MPTIDGTLQHPAGVTQQSPVPAAAVVGFALGGFFDGILLHQVLQWHHFLSLVSGERWRDLRQQVLADGLFHLGVYAIAAAGLWLLWRARHAAASRGAGRRMAAAALLGFALWQIVDIGVFHWAVGIHRVRVDVPNPLAWDLGWLGALGVAPLLVGLWLLRRPGSGMDAGGGRAAVIGLAALVLLAAPIASRPQPGTAATLVLFRPGLGPERAVVAALEAGARVIGADRSGELLLLDLREGSAWRLFRGGAILVGSSTVTGGCLAWSRVS